MTYEVKLALTGLASSIQDEAAYALYLDQVLGADKWLVTKLPGDPKEPWPEAATVVCSRDGMIKLKWVDIIDGEHRVMNERCLPANHVDELRIHHGGRLPWE